MTGEESTDVWFRWPGSLEELAAALGARISETDAENYWEWVIADFAGIGIDLTRTHTLAPGQTETRVFRYDSRAAPFPRSALRQLVTDLQRIGVDPVYVGRWVHRQGYEFDHVVHELVTAAS